MPDTVKTSASDIQAGDWVDASVPRPLQPYFRLARLDRPIGTWLLLFPCWWSLSLAAEGWPDPLLMALFAIGALIMRGAGCTINDIADRNFDSKVARTATRPLPSGALSLKQALAFLILQLLIGLLILAQLNPFTIAIGVVSLGLITVYPFMKRITYWPQAVLGLTFSWGALLGWAAVWGELAAPAVILYAAGFFWTLGYDTIYAHLDKEDDILIGVRSTALRLDRATPPWLVVFFGLAAGLIGVAGGLVGLGWPFYVGLVIGAGHLIWQALSVDIDNPADCLAKFKSNRLFGWIILFAVVAGRQIP